jgi:hypothetical protein
MTLTTTTLDGADNNFVLGKALRPLLTHAMGSAVEVFDTSGPAKGRAAAASPPVGRGLRRPVRPARGHGRRFGADPSGPQGPANVPAGAVHSYRNVTDVHFLTITTKGDAAAFFAEVANEV